MRHETLGATLQVRIAKSVQEVVVATGLSLGVVALLRAEPDAHTFRHTSSSLTGLQDAGVTVTATSESQGTILFGPERFTRGRGAPVSVMRRFETFGYDAPFLLYIQNGDVDGEARCSSATISLDGAIALGPSDFSQQVFEKSVAVMPRDVAQLEVRLASAPGCTVTLWIKGAPQLVGPDGGTVRYRGGVEITYPPGALTEPTPIEVFDLPVAATQAIIDERDQAYRSHAKRFLAGLTGRPDGLTFLVPVRARIPLLPLEPGELPVQISVDEERRTYWLTDTDVEYDGELGTASFAVRHFSGQGLAGAQQGNECATCGYWTTHPDECAALDPIQPSCCLVSNLVRGAREACAPTCDCCKEKGFTLVSGDASFDASFGGVTCEMASGTVTVTYPYCSYPCPAPASAPPELLGCPPGPVSEEDVVSGVSAGCEKDMTFKVNILPPTPMLVCDEATLGATLEATKKDGTRAFTTADFAPGWVSFDRNIADFTDPRRTGVVRAFAPGQATIKAQAPDDRYFAEAALTVRDRGATIGPTEPLEVGESREMSLSVEGLCGEGQPRPVCVADWSVLEGSSIELDTTAQVPRIKGKATGSSLIKAVLRSSEFVDADWCTAEFTATATIEVVRVPALISVNPEEVEILVGASRQLTAVVLDKRGDPMSVPVLWLGAPQDPVASVSSTGLLRGLSVGETTVAAAVIPPHVPPGTALSAPVKVLVKRAYEGQGGVRGVFCLTGNFGGCFKCYWNVDVQWTLKAEVANESVVTGSKGWEVKTVFLVDVQHCTDPDTYATCAQDTTDFCHSLEYTGPAGAGGGLVPPAAFECVSPGGAQTQCPGSGDGTSWTGALRFRMSAPPLKEQWLEGDIRLPRVQQP
jgi:hypothetical protein